MMSKDKFIKIPNHYGIIPTMGGIYGPINTPMKLESHKILELLSLNYGLVECIKNYKTDEFIGEVVLNIENYDKNNFNLIESENNTNIQNMEQKNKIDNDEKLSPADSIDDQPTVVSLQQTEEVADSDEDEMAQVANNLETVDDASQEGLEEAPSFNKKSQKVRIKK